MDVHVRFNQPMQTRDGVTLRADLYLPETDEPCPAIVLRTPYNKALRVGRFDGLHGAVAAAAGYAMVIQDVRGRYASEGEYQPITLAEGPDGYDCIQWVADQPWCDGNVGMIGGSYESLVQFMAAEQQPPALRAIVPEFSGDSRRGALMLDSINISWAAGQALDWITKEAAAGRANDADMAVVMQTLQDPQRAARHLPLCDMPLMNVGSLFTYQQMLGILRGVAGIRYDRIRVPALMIGGWYDIDPLGCLEILRGLQTQSPDEYCRRESAVVWGPWEHCQVWEVIGERSFGPMAAGQAVPLTDVLLAFFDRHLRHRDVPVPAARYFLGGTNTWKTASSWPPPGVTDVTWYLGRDAAGGTLDQSPPGAAAAWDEYAYDPADPVPSFGGRYFRVGGSIPGPFDQRRVESRPDVLTYTSAPLAEDLEVVGDCTAVLFFSTSAVDTDVAVKLCDVAADGLSHNVSDNFIRLRWRDGTDEPHFVEPDQVLELAVGLSPVGHVFRAGHRLRLQVTSSNFPAYDRNMNTGNPEGSDAVGKVAQQRVGRGGGHASRLELHVQPS